MTDLYSLRVLRLTFGIAIATAVAHAFEWAPPFLVAVLVGLFLAVLELYKRGRIQLNQEDAFGEIELVKLKGKGE